MLKQTYSALMLLMLLGGTAIAADNDDRDKLFGSWEEAGTSSASSWKFAGKGDSFHVTELERTTKVADYPCATDGKQCSIKIAGKKAEVSIWFNGPKLVVMETQGPTVVKRRFAVLPSGDMELEVIPIVPGGKTEKIQFKRVLLTASDK